ncbi:saposin B domain-containing protein [Tieghemostelium lacteum]|uniref:Saposin B domain-containing protein n=1 Tax=Tieghemostelium lacteum TaxID=361077 RepID=A0A152A7M1_TIELA|nr:saposin B domain-containing protein [Tieghemostelium lacteum]|eukprot:KYR02204.1 saposin B domain-containing protein [Tieghemostelium lacteum]
MKYLLALIVLVTLANAINIHVLQAPNPFECTLCTYLAGVTESYVGQNKTETEIITLLQTECNRLSSKFSSECDGMVQNYIPDIITYLENNFTPKQICQKVELCGPSSSSAPQDEVEYIEF